MGRKSKPTNFRKGVYDFLSEALKAEGATQTGKINITVTVLLGACLLVIIPVRGFETFAASVLSLFDKKPVELIPGPIVYLISIGSLLFFLLCLWVVRDMEIKKRALSQKDDK